MRFPVTASLRVDVCMKIIRALTFFILSAFAYTRVITVCVCVCASRGEIAGMCKCTSWCARQC